MSGWCWPVLAAALVLYLPGAPSLMLPERGLLLAVALLAARAFLWPWGGSERGMVLRVLSWTLGPVPALVLLAGPAGLPPAQWASIPCLTAVLALVSAAGRAVPPSWRPLWVLGAATWLGAPLVGVLAPGLGPPPDASPLVWMADRLKPDARPAVAGHDSPGEAGARLVELGTAFGKRYRPGVPERFDLTIQVGPGGLPAGLWVADGRTRRELAARPCGPGDRCVWQVPLVLDDRAFGLDVTDAATGGFVAGVAAAAAELRPWGPGEWPSASGEDRSPWYAARLSDPFEDAPPPWTDGLGSLAALFACVLAAGRWGPGRPGGLRAQASGLALVVLLAATAVWVGPARGTATVRTLSVSPEPGVVLDLVAVTVRRPWEDVVLDVPAGEWHALAGGRVVPTLGDGRVRARIQRGQRLVLARQERRVTAAPGPAGPGLPVVFPQGESARTAQRVARDLGMAIRTWRPDTGLAPRGAARRVDLGRVDLVRTDSGR